jgi:lactate dehydrogenase-like 2-hydroxyacid dehydrogenase
MTQTPAVLRAAKLSGTTNRELDASFRVHDLPDDPAAAERLLSDIGPFIRGIAVRKTLIDAALIDRLPALEIISSYSAGTENIDVAHARRRGIEVANTSHILAEEVANLALAQVLALTRNTINAHLFVRDGRWPGETFPLARSIFGMRIGIVGFGHIGSAIARRLATVGAEVSYCGPNRKPAPFAYFADVAELAAAVEMLVLTCPLTPATHGLIDHRILDALGPDGYLVNVSRGQIVDEAALIEALAGNRLAGAALDVFENEPEVPDALRQDTRVVLSPHIGSGTHQTRQLMGDAMVDALARRLGVTVKGRG